MSFRLIEDPDALREAGEEMASASRIALDCEAAGFHRYSDRLCLVQVTALERTWLFDPLSVDPREVLAPLLEDPAVQVVMHGADYDIRLLDRDLGIRVKGVFDTQSAAFLLGAPAVGLAALLEDRMGITLAKEHQRADWAERPLGPELLAYAASDTRHLIPLADLLWEELQAKGRGGWAEEEFRGLEEIRWEEDETDPVTRVKGARDLGPREATALRAALEWRDGIARERDRAPFRVISDSVLLGVVLERPISVEALGSLKGFSPRLARQHGRELLEALRRVDTLPDSELQSYPRHPRNGRGRPTPEEEALADRIRALRTARAQELGVERGVLFSNAQIAEVVRLRPRTAEALLQVPGVRGWQARVLGEPLLDLLR